MAVTVEATDTLFEAVRVPRQFVVDHDVAAVLEVDPLTRCVGREEQMGLPVVELVLDASAVFLVDAVMDDMERCL
ncbi:hypothetical protein SVXHx_3132 (plasmid) [Haloferax volcanii]|nr:hypothetical protein SVXHx_3132 [Haloferax lucentense]